MDSDHTKLNLLEGLIGKADLMPDLFDSIQDDVARSMKNSMTQTKERRILNMLNNGWVDEVSTLLDAGVSPDSQAFSALGYRRVVEYIRGQLNFDEMASRIQADTRHYAKRQWTWFRREPDMNWLPGFGTDCEVQLSAAGRLANTL